MITCTVCCDYLDRHGFAVTSLIELMGGAYPACLIQTVLLSSCLLSEFTVLGINPDFHYCCSYIFNGRIRSEDKERKWYA